MTTHDPELVWPGIESIGNVQLAADGVEALQQLEAAAPDLVIVDAELDREASIAARRTSAAGSPRR